MRTSELLVYSTFNKGVDISYSNTHITVNVMLCIPKGFDCKITSDFVSLVQIKRKEYVELQRTVSYKGLGLVEIRELCAKTWREMIKPYQIAVRKGKIDMLQNELRMME